MFWLLISLNMDIDLQKLYDHATTSLVQFQAEKDSAFDRLINMAQDTLYQDTVMHFLISKFDTKSASERHALKDMMLKVGTAAIPFIVEKIDYRGSDIDDRCLKQSLWVLSEIGGEAIIEPSGRYINDQSWQIRSNAFTALGKSKSAQALPYILPGLEDTIASVRKSAYYALSELATDHEIEVLLDGLDDGFYGVRYACAKGLMRIGAPAIPAITTRLGGNKPTAFFLVMSLVGMNETEDALIKYLDVLPPSSRYLIYEAASDAMMLELVAECEKDRKLYNYLKVKIKEIDQ